MKNYNDNYKNGYKAYMENTFSDEWTSLNIIPLLDEDGASEIVMLHYPYSHNPIGMDGEEHVCPGFFHARATKFGWWYVYNSENKRFGLAMNWLPDGWKKCNEIKNEWLEAYETIRREYE
jgi:hypothetical protein